MNNAAGRDEYVVLRTEQVYRIQALQTLIALIITGFFSSGVVIIGWGFGSSPTVKLEVFLWSTPALLGMVATATAVAVRWHRIIYRIGSYVVVFHERPGPEGRPAQFDLGWDTRIRRRRMRRSCIDRLLPSEGAFGPLALLFILACVPAIYALGASAEWTRPSHWTPLATSMGLAVAGIGLLLRLYRIGQARQEFLHFWESVRDDELRFHTDRPPGSSPGMTAGQRQD
jgi:hypothetical protein